MRKFDFTPPPPAEPLKKAMPSITKVQAVILFKEASPETYSRSSHIIDTNLTLTEGRGYDLIELMTLIKAYYVGG